MAERRMFAKTIVLSDEFLDMPMSARCLYFTMGMLADDDGFVNAPRSIMRQCGASMDDMKVLLAKKYVLEFDSGVIVIKHWRINNYLQGDRRVPTKYVEEKEMLTLKENNAYSLKDEYKQKCIHDHVYTDSVYTDKNSIDKSRIEENSIDKVSIEKKREGFARPTLEEVKAYVIEKGYRFDPEAFFSFYESNGWKVGKNPMKSWKDACTTWEKRESSSAPKSKKLSDMSNDKVTPLSLEDRQRLKGASGR